MSELPPSWTSARIEELGELKLGKMLDKAKNQGLSAKYLRNINVRWFRFDLGDMHTIFVSPAEIKQLSVEDGDLFVCEGGEPGRCAVWRGGDNVFVYQKALHRFRSHGGMVPELLMYRLRHDAETGSLADAFTGTTIKHLTRESLARFKVPVPPLPEQKRIADKLDALLARVDACRERLDRVAGILKRFRQSVLAAATSGELTREWRGGVDAQWEERSIEQLCLDERYALAIGPFGSNLKVADYRGEGVPLVFVREIRARKFGNAGTKFVTQQKAAELKAHVVRPGDLLITKMGDPPGDTAIYPRDHPWAIMTADVVCMRVDPRTACTSFVGYAIESPLGRERIGEITAGVAQRKISLERFRTMLLPMPPLPEQAEIARRVGELFELADRLERHLSAARDSIDRSTLCALAKAFRGELVPQDPNDEPASALLAKLKTAHAAPARSHHSGVRRHRGSDRP